MKLQLALVGLPLLLLTECAGVPPTVSRTDLDPSPGLRIVTASAEPFLAPIATVGHRPSAEPPRLSLQRETDAGGERGVDASW